MGAAQEDAIEGGGRAGHIGKVLSRGNKDGAVVWVGDEDVVRANGSEARGSSCGFPETDDEFEGKKAEGRFMAEGGGKKNTAGIRDTTPPDLLGQKADNGGVIGGPTAHI